MIAQGHRNIWCSTSDDSDCGAAQAGLLQRDLEPLWFKCGNFDIIMTHQYGPFRFSRISQLHPSRAVGCALLRAHADRVLIGC